MVQDAERMRDADEQRKNAVNSKNEAETLVYTVEKQMVDMKDKISEADKEDLNAKIAAVRATLASDASDEIQAKTKELQEASWKVTQTMYANSNNNSSEEGKKFEEGK
jgi:molecular chaperone DnaK